MQVCNRLKINCICIQKTVQSAESVQRILKETEDAENRDSQVHDNETEQASEHSDKGDEVTEQDAERKEKEGEKVDEESQSGTEEGGEQVKDFIDTEDLLSELDALANCDSDGNVRPRKRHIGLKRFHTRSKSRAKK